METSKISFAGFAEEREARNYQAQFGGTLFIPALVRDVLWFAPGFSQGSILRHPLIKGLDGEIVRQSGDSLASEI